jgi:hypothetical protein
LAGSLLCLFRCSVREKELTESLERAAMTNDDKSNDLYVGLAGMGLVCLVLLVIIVNTLRLVDNLGPQIGDIITFSPAKKISPDAQEAVAVTMTLAGSLTAVPCVLDPRTMLASGGSLVIEAVRPKPNPSYRVHWAGARTSDGRTDCGAQAEFLLNQSDIVALHLAAGN